MKFSKYSPLPKIFVDAHPDYECYALVNSQMYRKLYLNDNVETTSTSGTFDVEKFDGLVKIKLENKKVYRKCLGGAYVEDTIYMGYRTQKMLSGEGPFEVCRASWLGFMWHHPEVSIRYSFQTALVLGGLSIILSIASIVIALL